MKVVRRNFDYLEETDVLVRGYPNQSEHPAADEMFCGDVLFRPHMNRQNVQVMAAFPRGLVCGLVKHLRGLGKKTVVQVSNEIPPCVGGLTSCDIHFDVRFGEAIRGLVEKDGSAVQSNKEDVG